MVIANGQTDKIVGAVELKFTIDGDEITTRIRVLNSINYDIILVIDSMEHLQIRINFEDRTRSILLKVSLTPSIPKTRTLVQFTQ